MNEFTRAHTTLLGTTGAVFSPCKLYRYRLWRTWDASRPPLNFLMLNPSTADELANDPTVERCERRAQEYGFGGLVVTNLFAWRSTDRAVLRRVPEPVGEQNDAYILGCAQEAGTVICAWGNDGGWKGRSRAVLAMLCAANGIAAKLHALRITGAGEPEHPLYVGYDHKPQLLSELRKCA